MLVLVGAVAGVLLSVGAAAAQGRPVLVNPGVGFGVHFGGGGATFSDQFDVALGMVGEGRISYTWSRGVGVQAGLSRAGLSLSQGNHALSARLLELAAEVTLWPRVSRTVGTRVGPRVGRIERAVDDPVAETRSVSRGWFVGAAVGAFGKLNRHLGFTGDLVFDVFWLGDQAVEGLRVPETGSNGTTLRLMLGVQVAWPGSNF